MSLPLGGRRPGPICGGMPSDTATRPCSREARQWNLLPSEEETPYKVLRTVALKQLKPRLESGPDCLICAEFTRQRCANKHRCRANMAHVRQAGPDSGLGFQVKVLKNQIVPSSLGSGLGEGPHGSADHSGPVQTILDPCRPLRTNADQC